MDGSVVIGKVEWRTSSFTAGPACTFVLECHGPSTHTFSYAKHLSKCTPQTRFDRRCPSTVHFQWPQSRGFNTDTVCNAKTLTKIVITVAIHAPIDTYLSVHFNTACKIEEYGINKFLLAGKLIQQPARWSPPGSKWSSRRTSTRASSPLSSTPR
jgi:hypothetical protein